MMISPIPDSDAASPMSPAIYIEPPLPALVGSPTTLPVENALQTRDQFLPYTVSPEHVSYAPVVSPVAIDSPATRSSPSPRSPAAMDRILAGDVDLLMDNESDLPILPSSLLPVPSPRVMPPEPPVVPSAGGLLDLSRVMDTLPGCQYRTTTYEDTQATTADLGYGLQLQNPRFLEYVGTPELARLLTRSP